MERKTHDQVNQQAGKQASKQTNKRSKSKKKKQKRNQVNLRTDKSNMSKEIPSKKTRRHPRLLN